MAAATTPATTKAGAAQPPSVRPVEVRRDCGPGSRPGGKWGWPSRATAIERASCPSRVWTGERPSSMRSEAQVRLSVRPAALSTSPDAHPRHDEQWDYDHDGDDHRPHEREPSAPGEALVVSFAPPAPLIRLAIERRGGRVVECTGLENRSPFTRTAGSNPAPSARPGAGFVSSAGVHGSSRPAPLPSQRIATALETVRRDG